MLAENPHKEGRLHLITRTAYYNSAIYCYQRSLHINNSYKEKEREVGEINQYKSTGDEAKSQYCIDQLLVPILQ